MLGGFLDWYHAVVMNKIDGLTDDDTPRCGPRAG